jgi:hypothetical protein
MLGGGTQQHDTTNMGWRPTKETHGEMIWLV